MGTIQDVEQLQDKVVTQTTDVFTQMKQVYNGAMSRALQDIDATFTFNPAIEEPAEPPVQVDLVKALAYLDALRGALLHRPNYPTFSYTSPQLPTLDTTPPDLSDIVVPAPPDLLMPTFDAVLEDEQIVSPSATFDFSDIPYSSALHDALWSLLLDEVQNGGYGINTNDETRLFERAREREQRALDDKVDEAIEMYSSGGFAAPTGAMAAAIQRAQAETAEKVSTLNRDIMVQRSELYLKGKELNQSGILSMEKQDSDLHSAKMDRSLKAAAQRITSILEIAAFQIERVKLFMEKYKTLAAVFETQVKVESAKAEMYKVQVEAKEIEIKLNMARLEEFVQRNKAIVDIFLAQIEEYKARIDGYTKYIGALADEYKADASVYGATADSYGKSFDMEAKFYGSRAEYAVALLNSRAGVQKLKFDALLGRAQLELEGEKAEAQSAAQVTAAALSAMNINATLSAQASAGITFAGSVSEDRDNNVLTTISVQG